MILAVFFVVGSAFGAAISTYRWFALVPASLLTVAAAYASAIHAGEGAMVGLGAGALGVAAMQMSYLVMVLRRPSRASEKRRAKVREKVEARTSRLVENVD